MTRYKLLRIMPYKLLSFLIKHKCLKNYVNNILNSPYSRTDKMTKMLLKSEYALSLLFPWANTPEGYEYWNTVNELYHIKIWQTMKRKNGEIGKNAD